ncbi:MAG: Multidrug resistance protein NorM [Bacteroidetes bacterium ADurb.Bin302]|nr:MAG: Multidrug resistance protein NorM [Bacteroidetes bacterium ADurb.Bin302]HPG55128.1 MATE family efflux transporter [Candidatus Enterocola sp.]
MTFEDYLPYYKRNLRIAGPVVLSQLGGSITQLADNIMVGHLGTVELAAVSFANTIFIIGMLFSIGITMASTPLIGQAYVQGEHTKLTSYLQNSLLQVILTAIVISALLFALYPFMDDMGQEPDVVKLAKPYYILLVISLFPFLIFCFFKQFLEGLGSTKHAMIITIICNIVNIVLNYFLIFGTYGFPKWGIIGAGVATLLSRVLMPIMFLIIIRKKTDWWMFFNRFGKKVFSFKVLRELHSLGLPIAGQMVLEISAFAFSAIMVGWLGAVPLASHQIAQNISTIAFMVVLGISTATTIRVSHQLGLRDFKALRMAASASIHLCLATNFILGLLILSFRYIIPIAFTEDAAVIELAAQLLLFVGLFQLFDGMQSVGIGILRGLTDVKRPVIYAFISYICINLPIGYIFAFVFKMGAAGIWLGFVFGLGVAAILFHIRYRKRINELESAYYKTC